MDLEMKGATVLISGGSKGMGRACALGFAREGARVIVTARNPAVLEPAAAELRAAGAADALALRCDIGCKDDIAAVFAEIEDRYGQLNTLINMAGPTDPEHLGADFAQTSDESWDYYYQVGLQSVIRACRFAVPLMRKAGWGRIVNISSQTARLGEPGQAGYMVMKSALNTLTKNMAWGLAKENILVNSVTPGGVYSELMAEHMRASDCEARGFDPATLEGAAAWLADYVGARSVGAIGRVATPDELAPQIMLLGSKINSFCTGTNVAVDGGTDFSTG